MLVFIASIFFLWILNLYFNIFFSKRNFRLGLKGFIWFTFYLIHYYVLNSFHHLVLNFILSYILLVILCISLYVGNFKKVVYICLLGHTSGMLIEISTSILLQQLGYTAEGTATVGSIISKLILLALVHAISIRKFQKSYSEPAFFYWLLLFVTTISSILIIHTVFLLSRTTQSKRMEILSSTAILALFFINMALFIIYDKLSHSTELHLQNQVMHQQIAHYHEAIANKKAQDTFFKRERHNLKNQLITLRSYAAHNQNESIIAFINKLLQQNEFGLCPWLYCNNLILDTLISSKKNIAEENNITYTVDINVPSALPFDDVDLCVLVGNALDNAFEACLSSKDYSPFVDITIRYKNECLYCHFVNSYFHKLSTTSNGFFNSTKKESFRHGYGLNSIKNIVDKYNGILVISTETSNAFSLNLSLYRPPQN